VLVVVEGVDGAGEGVSSVEVPPYERAVVLPRRPPGSTSYEHAVTATTRLLTQASRVLESKPMPQGDPTARAVS